MIFIYQSDIFKKKHGTLVLYEILKTFGLLEFRMGFNIL